MRAIFLREEKKAVCPLRRGSANARKRFSLARSVTLFPAAVREPTSLAVHDNFQASDAAASVPASSPPRPRLGTIGGGEAICMSGKL